MKKLAILFFSLYAVIPVLGGGGDPIGGARALSLGGSSLGLRDHWSVFHNQAGLAHVEGFSAGAFYQSNFMLAELSTRGAAVALPAGPGVFGLAIRSFGYNRFQQGSYGLAYAMKLNEAFSVGVQLNYFNTVIAEGYGSRGGLIAELGFQYMAGKSVMISGHLYNPHRAKLTDFNDERVPTLLRGGVQYIFSERTFMTAEVRKDIDRPVSFRAGAEYRIVEKLLLRAGVGTDPALTAFGLGIDLEHFVIDLGTAYHSVLGFIPQVSLSYHAR